MCNIWPVKFKTTYSIFHICIQSKAICLQIKNFNILIIITSCYTSFFLITRVIKCDSPTIRLNRFTLSWFKRNDWRFLPRIPDTNKTIWISGNKLRSSVFETFSTYSFNYIRHSCGCLNIKFGFRIFNIKNLQTTFKVKYQYISCSNRTTLKCTELYPKLF